jgi:nucleoside-diphosphate-sugar epimerase
LNTPPLTNLTPEEFVNKIPDDYKKIIFISSISVYGAASGCISESTRPEPVTKSGIWLHQVEQLLLAKFKSHISIIRAGGLIGGERHPVVSLSKKLDTVVEDTPINMIHRDDLIEIIFSISKMKVPPGIVNAVTPYHPMKSAYYGAWSKILNCAPIRFSSPQGNSKIVTSEVLPEIYSYWRNPNLDTL